MKKFGMSKKSGGPTWVIDEDFVIYGQIADLDRKGQNSPTAMRGIIQAVGKRNNYTITDDPLKQLGGIYRRIQKQIDADRSKATQLAQLNNCATELGLP